ncbi:efflux RND transporter periplasmic adaptor subunit [Cohnella terricola]|uniref:efflux RND transporter periplasmic adaptor subunit n=1 Tax=Cohnella terricola TaxID=1289167 RepID=UPI001647871D|nr:efflux RND transporter periplasmic adaptor subunit [Cohnella terricola]
MSRTLNRTAAAALSLLLGSTLAGCSLLPKEEEALKPPLVKPVQENYSTVTAEKGSIVKAITGSATFESVATEIAQYSGKGGRIDKILVKSGDQVKKGDILVQLILDGLDIQLKEQQLALEKAKYAVRQARNADDQALKIAELQFEVEQMKYDRLSEQFNSKQLKAKMDGEVVFAESLNEGDYVEAYQTLVTVADPTKLRLALRVEDPKDIHDVAVGVPAEITLKGEKVSGKVTQTPASSPETANKDLMEKYNRTLYIEVPNLPKDAEIGLIASVKIITEQREDVIKIPRSGLRSYLGRNFVRVLEDGTRLREIDVEPGIVGSTEIEIVKGLTEGQVVVMQ